MPKSTDRRRPSGAAAGSDTVGYVRMDFCAIAREVAGMASKTAKGKRNAGKIPAIPADSAPVTVIVNRGTDEIRARVSFDVGKVAGISGALRK